ncbi:MAG: hypothetical protein QOG35_2509 [Solirubrobacteraceae bacterium]|jgi:hypothetical protein|nr:hypothetical protein [Solirubrobacteraceae bacterium]
MGFVLALLTLSGLVALAVTAPMTRRAGEPVAPGARRAELEAARDAKYRELREAQLDFRMGKVSPDDHRQTDRELRAQAIDILRELDSLDPDGS